VECSRWFLIQSASLLFQASRRPMWPCPIRLQVLLS